MRDCATVKSFSFVGISGTRDGESGSSGAFCVGEVLEFVVEKCGVTVKGEAEGCEGRRGFGRGVGKIWVFVEVAETFFVFVKSEWKVVGFECSITVDLEIGYDFDDFGGCWGGGHVFWEVFCERGSVLTNTPKNQMNHTTKKTTEIKKKKNIKLESCAY